MFFVTVITYDLYNKMAMGCSGCLILLQNLDMFRKNFLVHSERKDGCLPKSNFYGAKCILYTFFSNNFKKNEITAESYEWSNF